MNDGLTIFADQVLGWLAKFYYLMASENFHLTFPFQRWGNSKQRRLIWRNARAVYEFYTDFLPF